MEQATYLQALSPAQFDALVNSAGPNAQRIVEQLRRLRNADNRVAPARPKAYV